jgi:hypothetical protein
VILKVSLRLCVSGLFRIVERIRIVEQRVGTMSGFVLIRPGRTVARPAAASTRNGDRVRSDFAALTASGDLTRTISMGGRKWKLPPIDFSNSQKKLLNQSIYLDFK